MTSSTLSWTATLPMCTGPLAILGVLCHRLYFIYGEHHLKAPLYLGVWVLFSLLLAFVIILTRTFEPRYIHAIKILEALVFTNVAFFGPLIGSIVVYRIFQHPLTAFDGPRLAAVSKLWHLYHMLTTPNNMFLHNLQRQYGNIIRTGPQELTIITPEVFQAIHGPGTSCIKAAWYDMLSPFVALNSIRAKDKYRARRKRWDDALGLSTSYIPDKELRVHYYAALLLQQIDSFACNPINITALLYHFSFDVMGDLSFGKSFSLISGFSGTTEPDIAPKLMSQGMSMLRFFTPTPWLAHICFFLAPYIPIITQKWNRALNWAAEACDARLQDGDRINKDIFSRFIASAQQENDDDSLDQFALYGDAFAITVAGSHTSATALTFLFYELSQRTALQEALRDEINEAGVMMAVNGNKRLTEKMDISALERLPLLDACINEVLRLYPVVPTGGIRQTTEKGITIGDKWIPPYTIIVAPRWSIGRLNSAFEEPTEFIPERWTTRPEMVKDARAFNAFGLGRHVCPGKKLGILMIRLVATMILSNFELRRDPSNKEQIQVLGDMRDSFTAQPGRLDLVFKPLIDVTKSDGNI